MSTVEVTPGDIAASTSKRARALANHRIVMLVSAFVVLAAMSFTRIWTDQQALTSSQTIGTALRVMVPILMAGIAALWAERCGVLNIGIEGMMIFGTWFGGYFAWQHGAWVGLAMGVLGGMIAGTIHAVATVHFGVNQTISGVVMNIFAFYGARYLSDLLFDLFQFLLQRHDHRFCVRQTRLPLIDRFEHLQNFIGKNQIGLLVSGNLIF